MRMLFNSALSLLMLTTACAQSMEQRPPIATSGAASEKSMIEEIVFLLNGEFDSRNQKAEDEAKGVPEKDKHFHVNRTFLLTDAPTVGAFVMVGTTAYNAPPWIFDQYEFLVWTFAQDTDRNHVTMTPYRFKEQEKRTPFSRSAEKLAGFTMADLEPARGASKCVITWTRAGNGGFSGHSAPRCEALHTPTNKMGEWRWRYALREDALWVEFSGIDVTGAVLEQTPPGKPYRLDRIH